MPAVGMYSASVCLVCESCQLARRRAPNVQIHSDSSAQK